MSWLNNFKITYKIGLIVAMLGLVMVGVVSFAAIRMKSIDDSYSDLVDRVDKYTALAVRAARYAEAYTSAAFQLAAETSDAGNVKYLALTVESRKRYETTMADVLKNMPEKAALAEPVLAGFAKAFTACGPGIEYASKTNTSEENMKAADRLKAECVPSMEAALHAQTKMVDTFLADGAKASDEMTVHSNSSINTVLVTSGIGILVSLALALWIGARGPGPSDYRSQDRDGSLCPQRTECRCARRRAS
jgi:methyl-accepting chemotaxis protein